MLKNYGRIHNNSLYNSIKQFSELFNIPLTSSVGMKQSSFIKKLAKVLKQKYLEEWYYLKQKYSVGKLDTYTKIKCSFDFEKHLNIQNFPHRRNITRLRILAHRLAIEIGRCGKLDRADRLCSKCSLDI